MSKDRKKVIHIHSNVNDKQPTPSTLELGELGVNNAKGNAFISTKNDNNEVVRFSEDETIINWMEKKEVIPYEGEVRVHNRFANKSTLNIKLNQYTPSNTPYADRVNDAKDKLDNTLVNPSTDDGLTNGAGISIDMSDYALTGGSASFSASTIDCSLTVNGTTNLIGKDGDCGSALNVDVNTICEEADDKATLYGANKTNVGINCAENDVSTVTNVSGDSVNIGSANGNIIIKGYNGDTDMSARREVKIVGVSGTNVTVDSLGGGTTKIESCSGNTGDILIPGIPYPAVQNSGININTDGFVHSASQGATYVYSKDDITVETFANQSPGHPASNKISIINRYDDYYEQAAESIEMDSSGNLTEKAQRTISISASGSDTGDVSVYGKNKVEISSDGNVEINGSDAVIIDSNGGNGSVAIGRRAESRTYYRTPDDESEISASANTVEKATNEAFERSKVTVSDPYSSVYDPSIAKYDVSQDTRKYTIDVPKQIFIKSSTTESSTTYSFGNVTSGEFNINTIDVPSKTEVTGRLYETQGSVDGAPSVVEREYRLYQDGTVIDFTEGPNMSQGDVIRPINASTNALANGSNTLGDNLVPGIGGQVSDDGALTRPSVSGITVPEYWIKGVNTSGTSSDNFWEYQLMRGNSAVGDTINIPRDYLLNNVEIVEGLYDESTSIFRECTIVPNPSDCKTYMHFTFHTKDGVKEDPKEIYLDVTKLGKKVEINPSNDGPVKLSVTENDGTFTISADTTISGKSRNRSADVIITKESTGFTISVDTSTWFSSVNNHTGGQTGQVTGQTIYDGGRNKFSWGFKTLNFVAGDLRVLGSGSTYVPLLHYRGDGSATAITDGVVESWQYNPIKNGPIDAIVYSGKTSSTTETGAVVWNRAFKNFNERYPSGSKTPYDSGGLKYGGCDTPWIHTGQGNFIHIPVDVGNIFRNNLKINSGKPNSNGYTYDPGGGDKYVDRNFDINIPTSLDHLIEYSGGCYQLSHDICMANNYISAKGVYSSSDERLKENINDLSNNDLNGVDSISFKSFNFKDDLNKTKTYGVIAQDVLKSGHDELVHTDVDGMMSVDYTSLLIMKIAKLEQVIKEMSDEINKLKNNK